MAIYTPDNFVIIKITTPKEKIYKVLAGWSGGYLTSDRWQMNSGIKSYTFDGEIYLFNGYSGSTYSCHKDTERFNNITASVYNSYSKQAEDIKNTSFEYVSLAEFAEEFVEEFDR